MLDHHAMKKPTRHLIFILLCGLHKTMVIPAIESMPRTPIRGRNPEGGRRKCSTAGLVPSQRAGTSPCSSPYAAFVRIAP